MVKPTTEKMPTDEEPSKAKHVSRGLEPRGHAASLQIARTRLWPGSPKGASMPNQKKQL